MPSGVPSGMFLSGLSPTQSMGMPTQFQRDCSPTPGVCPSGVPSGMFLSGLSPTQIHRGDYSPTQECALTACHSGERVPTLVP